MLEELTPEQEARIPSFVDEWRKIGTCTDPADRPTAEAAISKIYGDFGAAAPEFIWVDSPLAAAAMFGSIHQRSSTPDGPPPRDTHKESTGWLSIPLEKLSVNEARHNASSKMHLALDEIIGPLWWMSPCASIRTPLTLSVKISLATALQTALMQLPPRLQTTLSVDICIDDAFLGQHEVYWISHYMFAVDAANRHDAEIDECLGWWADIAKSCCWWWPYKGVCIISDRPEVCRLENGVIHADDGPCVRFRDGWSLWAIRGVVVDEQVVMRPETQTLAQIRADDNLERKRIRIERYGWARYLDEVGAEVLDERNNDIEASREALLRSSDGELVLVARCPSTHKVFHMEVLDPAVTTCEQAQTWLHGGLNHYFTGRA